MIHKSVVLGMIQRINNWTEFESVGMDIIKLSKEGKLTNNDIKEIRIRLNKKERELNKNGP